MEYQKIINLLDYTTNQRSKFRTRNWNEVNDDLRGTYDNSGTKFKTSMIRSDLCDYSDYSDAYIFVSRTIIITGEGDDDAAKKAGEREKSAIIENCLPFTKCITSIKILV